MLFKLIPSKEQSPRRKVGRIYPLFLLKTLRILNFSQFQPIIELWACPREYSGSRHSGVRYASVLRFHHQDWSYRITLTTAHANVYCKWARCFKFSDI